MKRIAIVTGASSGIGEAYVRLIHSVEKDIDELWVVARREDRLKKLSDELGQIIVPVVCDISSEEGINKISDKLAIEKPDVAVLINCAGIGYRGKFESLSEKQISSVLEVNCLALTRLTRICLDYMKAGSGIINVASTAGFLPQKGFATYSASKAYVINFSRALFYELKGCGIRVTCVAPGPVNTEFQKLATGKENFEGFRAAIAADPMVLANKSYKAFKKGKSLYCHGFTQKAFHFACKILPTAVMAVFVNE